MRNHKGNLNPMYGKRHSEESKRQISDTQKERYKELNNAYMTQHVKMDELLQSESFNQWLKQILREEMINLL